MPISAVCPHHYLQISFMKGGITALKPCHLQDELCVQSHSANMSFELELQSSRWKSEKTRCPGVLLLNDEGRQSRRAVWIGLALRLS
jgi:hypothetical protein